MRSRAFVMILYWWIRNSLCCSTSVMKAEKIKFQQKAVNESFLKYLLMKVEETRNVNLGTCIAFQVLFDWYSTSRYPRRKRPFRPKGVFTNRKKLYLKGHSCSGENVVQEKNSYLAAVKQREARKRWLFFPKSGYPMTHICWSNDRDPFCRCGLWKTNIWWKSFSLHLSTRLWCIRFTESLVTQSPCQKNHHAECDRKVSACSWYLAMNARGLLHLNLDVRQIHSNTKITSMLIKKKQSFLIFAQFYKQKLMKTNYVLGTFQLHGRQCNWHSATQASCNKTPLEQTHLFSYFPPKNTS